MADSLTNGTNAGNADVEMKEEAPAEVERPEAYARRLHEMLISFQDSLSSIQQAAPSDQSASVNPAMLSSGAEHLSTIQPAAPAIATPPAASSAGARPGSMPPQPSARPPPEVAVKHGGPTRQYLNTHVTPTLLEAMKQLAVDEPAKPLLRLSEILREKSRELEGT